MAYKEKACKLCSKVFTPTSGNQVVCQGECKRLYALEKERAREHLKKKKYYRTCPACSKLYITTDSRRKYCGLDACELVRCRIKNRRAEILRTGSRVDESRQYYINNRGIILDRNQSRYREKALLDGREVKEYVPKKVVKHTLETATVFFAAEGYTVLSKTFKNTYEKLLVRCPKGHEWYTTLHNFKDSANRCLHCYSISSGPSAPELALQEYVRSLGVEVICNTRYVISPYELDLYVPAKNLAIEYCGLHWHGDKVGQDKKHLRHKMDLCVSMGIRLITIFEDEYLERPEVVYSRVAAAVGNVEDRVFARKCTVEVILNTNAAAFLKTNHLQGSTGCKVAFGLFYQQKLLQVLTMGALARSHAGKGGRYLELKRLASLPGVIVVGGASKLFKAAKKWVVENDYTHIKSYCDMRWANPFRPVYEVLGFDLAGETKYTPHYFKSQKRYRNQSLRKTPAERLTGKTEWELRQAQGYDRIWDCGHRTYVCTL